LSLYYVVVINSSAITLKNSWLMSESAHSSICQAKPSPAGVCKLGGAAKFVASL
jgi:hypothetical protein